MPQVLDNIIVAALPDPETGRVTLHWRNGATTIHDFSGIAGKGAFAPLADPATFVQVRLGGRGRSLEWPGDIDFCADALWFETHPEDRPQPPSAAARSEEHTIP